MSFLAVKNKISKKTFITALFAVLFFGLSTLAFAQLTPNDPDTDPPGAFQGTVQGFAWMGTGIQNPNSSEGGGGWLKFNCSPDDCSNSWGVRADMDPNSSRYGYFDGQAWSNNYGWLDFSADNVASCWEANPAETINDTARIIFPTGEVQGWAKFLAGDDFPNDGWDGCVSFSGNAYGVKVNLTTGVVSGWAWGSDVVGWISFTNPECPFCDVTIVLDDVVGCMESTADNYNPNATVPGRCIYRGCTNPAANNYDPIANVDDGSCTFGPPVRGCMDPTADNYNPAATVPMRCIWRGCTNPLATNYDPQANVDDGSCRLPSGGGRPTLDLQAAPNTLYVGSGAYTTGLTWTSSAPSQLSGCVGSLTGTNIFDTGTQTIWDGSRLPPNVTTPFNVDLAPYAATASSGDQYTFKLTCNLSGGPTIIFDTAVVNMIDPINPPTPASIWLHIEEPNNPPLTGSLLSEIISSGGVNPLTLRWEAVNVVANSCTADSQMFSGSTTTEIGPNASWSGQTLSLDGNDQGTQNLNIMNPSVINNTKFQITCEPISAPGTTITAQVCMGVDGRTFPASACSAGNSTNRPPGYKEI